MTRRNQDIVNSIIELCIATATRKQGITAEAIQEATGLNKSTVYRILRNEPGFDKSIAPLFPKGYYYSHDKAAVDMQNKAKLIAKGEGPRAEVTIKTHLGPAHYTNLNDQLTRVLDEPTLLHEFIPTVIQQLELLNTTNPSSGKFPGDISAQVDWFEKLTKASAACRVFHELARAIQEDERMQEPDFWLMFIKPN